ncbi:MAG: hypothetical protein NPINA01_32690 [Nitrospinaceae bacterium]|nr:MAG: hypothetical protein NPINA01_32690 [Nitrospinaceae bacterium]
MTTAKMWSSTGYKFAVATLFFVFALQTGISTVFAGDLVRKVQEALTERAYEPGPADGIWGPRTKSAVMKFQESEGLSATGELDGPTKSRLLGSMSAAAPAPAKAASKAKVMPVSDTGPDVSDSEIVWGRHKP